MVNYHSPVTIAREFAMLVKVWHFLDGIYVWEYFTTLGFEWDVIRGNRPYRWTIWVYSLTRLSTLMAVILNMVGFDITIPINCQVWVTFDVFFAYFGFATSSLLVVLRVIAVWDRNMIVVVMSMGIWMTDIGCLIHGISGIRSTWSFEANTCKMINIETTKYSVLASFFTDVVLLLIMLFGLLRMRLEGRGSLSLGSFLWKQGLIWLLLATVAEVPSSTFMLLNLNGPLDLLPQTFCIISVTIAATRIYRSLMNFNTSETFHETQVGGRALSEMRVRFRSVQLEVTVCTEHDQFPTLPSPQSSCVGTDREGYMAHEVSVKGDEESLPEK